MWDYTDKVREHFLNPRNVGEIENASAIGEVGSLACGDALKLMLQIDEKEKIVDGTTHDCLLLLVPLSFSLHPPTTTTTTKKVPTQILSNAL